MGEMKKLYSEGVTDLGSYELGKHAERKRILAEIESRDYRGNGIVLTLAAIKQIIGEVIEN